MKDKSNGSIDTDIKGNIVSGDFNAVPCGLVVDIHKNTLSRPVKEMGVIPTYTYDKLFLNAQYNPSKAGRRNKKGPSTLKQRKVKKNTKKDMWKL